MGEGSRNPLIHLGRVFEPDPAYAHGFGHDREIWVLECGPEREKPGGFLLELDEAERTVVEHHHLQREPVLRRG